MSKVICIGDWKKKHSKNEPEDVTTVQVLVNHFLSPDADPNLKAFLLGMDDIHDD